MGSYSIDLPTDGGFLRRECPSCERQFKWHDGPFDSTIRTDPDPDLYWCPYCGATADPNAWWTPEQLAFAQETVIGPALRGAADELSRGLGQASGGLFEISVNYDEGEPPSSLHEPSDMVIVQSPCHPSEPVKLDDTWTEPVHCLVCGQKYAI